MFLEYRDKHGKTEEEARACAVQEVIEGINAIEEIKAGESEFRRALGRERMAQEQVQRSFTATIRNRESKYEFIDIQRSGGDSGASRA